jgi:Tfp pilus assembly protein PilW
MVGRRPVAAGGPGHRNSKSEGGFTLVEFMISALVMTLVLGGAVALSMQIQQAYSTRLADEAVEQEARYALDWIARDLRSAASDPYDVIPLNQGIWLDPNGGSDPNDSIRLQADINPADGDIADAGEDVTIALDSANRVITRRDSNGASPVASAMTDGVITDLEFTCFNADGNLTASSELVAYIRVEVTAASGGHNPYSSTLATAVRVRTR